MGFDAYLWRMPEREASTPFDFDEVCTWSGRRSYSWMHGWLTSHGSPSEGDEDVHILSANDLLDFHAELVKRHEDSPTEEEEDAEIVRVACELESAFEVLTCVHLPLGKPRGLSGGCFGARKYRQGHEGGLMS